ncbi:MAG: crossover junction endodeoxyribonuclease RuvC [Kiritimatiellia bacterium]
MARDAIKIIGIDTSLRSTGIGIIHSNGVQSRASSYGAISCPKSWPLSRCLQHLSTRIVEILDEESPDVAAIEGIFYCRNVKTAIALGHARGVVIAACSQKGLAVYEYPPRSVKKGIVGTGAASKEQIAQMVKTILGLKEVPQEDAADALSIAMCHAQHARMQDTLGIKPI